MSVVACMAGHVDCTRMMCEQGAAIEKVNSDVSTPLHVACAKNQTATARLLCELGAAVDPANFVGACLRLRQSDPASLCISMCDSG